MLVDTLPGTANIRAEFWPSIRRLSLHFVACEL
jgi:hypothetical protein